MKLFKSNKHGALLILSAILSFICRDLAFAQSGKDGAKNVNTVGVIVNEYTAITSNIAVGANTITVASSGLNTNNRFTSSLSAGDLIMIIQMQGVSITHPDDTTYGEIISYNDCGNYELCQVAAVVNSNTISLSCATKNSYSATGRAQVVRVPRYTTLDVLSGGSITCPAWDGTLGGVLVIEADGNINIASGGIITATGKGFRGGQMNENLTFYGVGNDAWPSSDYGGEKGEGVVGYQADYDLIGGRYCKGPPANGGGGANAHNAGGGGGGNAGSLPWNGKGMPDPAYAVAWNLEYTGFASSVSSGGGKGGYTFSSTNQNELVVGPLNTAWGGDYRRNNGGRGGRPLDYTTGRIFLGGGGGSGDQNDLKGGGGGSGGGLIYITSRGTISGAGSISSDGNNGINSAVPPIFVTSADGAGGGGAGGTVLINSQGLITGLTISATGGKGGNQNVAAGSLDAYGPGGGGGGGYIATTSAVVTRIANGGLNGTTNSFSMTSFPPNGATSGGAGLPNESLSSFSFSCAGVTICPNTSTTLNATFQGTLPPGTVFTWYSSPTSTSIGTGVSFTTPVLSSTTTYYLGTCPGFYRIPVQVTVGTLTASFIPDTICEGALVSLNGIASSSPGTITNWSWNYGDATTLGTTQNTIHLYSSPGTYPVTLTVNNSVGCQTTFSANIVVQPSPQINFSVSSTSGCAPLNVTFSNTTSNAIGLFNWYFGDGGSSTITSPGYSYSSAGIYTVTLVATNGNCADTLIRAAYITVNPTPLASCVPSNTSLCLGDTVFFNNTSTGNGSLISGYTWNFGDGTPFSNQSSPYHVYTSSGSYQVRLTTTTAVCSDDTIITINVNPSPVAGFTTNQTTGCGPSTITFNNTSTGSPAYSWNFGDASPLSSLSSPSHTYSNSGTYNVTLIATQGTCADTLTRNAYVAIYPQPISSFSTANVCLGDTMHFNNLTSITGGTISGYTWNFGDGSPFVNTLNANHVYATAGTYQVRLTATTIHCTDDTVITVVVNPSPQVNFSSNATTGCGPTTITFSNTSSGASNYSWNFGDGTLGSSLSAPVHLYSQSGTYTVTLIAQQGQCFDTLIRNNFITINTQPFSSFSAAGGCVGDSVHFVNLSTGAPFSSLQWNFGDGFTSANSSPAHLYAASGSYNVTLSLSNGTCIDDTVITVNVSPSPIAQISAPVISGCSPFQVNFSNLTTGSPNYYWDFGDGISSNLQQPVHTYQNGGNYAVVMVASLGTCSDTASLSISVAGSPSASFNVPMSVCLGTPAVFQNTSSNGSYTWNFGDGTAPVFTSSPSHIYTSSGSFFVSLTVNNNGCIDSVAQVLVVNALPTVNFTASATSGCDSLQVVFNSISSGGNIFSWNFGDGSTGTGATVTHNYNTSGIYTIDLTTTAVNGCSATRAKQNFITVRSSPVPSITTGTQNICLDDCVSFQGVSTGSPVSWTWNLPGARPSTAFGSSTGSVCYSQLGNYAATLTVNDGYCTGTTTLNNIVRVNNCYVAPIADFIVSDSAICSGECLSFVSMSLNATGWRWNFPGATPITSTLEQPTGICYSSPGSYPVVLIASNPTGADTITYSNLISVSSPPPPPSFSQTGNTLSAPPGYQYQWYFNNIAISGANNVNYTATLSGNYAVEIIDANGCTAISSIQHISLVGVNDLEGIASLNIYPNPTSDFLIIETICLSQKQLKISLVDGLGRALLDKEVSLLIGQNSIKLDISQFAAGTYFIHVDGIGSMIKKIVKF